MRGDWLKSRDPAFGVKKSLIVGIKEVTSEPMAKKCVVPLGMKLLEYKYVVVTTAEAAKLQRQKAQYGTRRCKVDLHNDLPFLAVN